MADKSPGQNDPVPPQDYPITAIVLDRLKLKLGFRLDVEHTTIDLMYKQIDAMCALEMMGQQVSKTETVDFVFYSPANWFEHLKSHLYTRKWWSKFRLRFIQKKYPVKYLKSTHSRTITFTEQLIFPDINFLNSNRHIRMQFIDKSSYDVETKIE